MAKNFINSVIAKAKELNSGIDFMEGREKADIPVQQVLTLDDYGFLTDGEKEQQYVVLSFTEYPDKFFFGGSVVTKKLQELDSKLSDDEKESLKEEGLEVMFEKKKSKNKGKNDYMVVTFCPTEE